MEEIQDGLRAEIAGLMEQVMEQMGVGTMVIPDEIQRGMMETAVPSLDAAGLRALRDDLKALL
jgi:TRAP-type mannitol/chloroaromatic compound transport system substrate-binding protein